MKRLLTIALLFAFSAPVLAQHGAVAFRPRAAAASVVKIEIAFCDLPTTVTTVNCEHASMSDVKGAIVFASNASAYDTETNGISYSKGISDLTTDVFQSGIIKDGVATTHAKIASGGTGQVVRLYDFTEDTPLIDGECDLSATTSTGITLNCTNAFASAYKAMVVLIGGTDANTVIDGPDTHTGAIDTEQTWTFTGLSGLDAGFVLGHASAFTPVITDPFQQNWGWFVRDLEQCSTVRTSRDDQTSAKETHLMRTARVWNDLTGATSRAAEVTAVTESTNSTVGITKRDKSDSFTLAILGIDLDGAAADIQTYTYPTSGNLAVTGVGFQPDFVLHMASTAAALNTAYSTSPEAESMFYGAFTDSDEGGISISADDGASTTDAEVIFTNTQAVWVRDFDATDRIKGTFSSFDADGWTISLSAQDGSTARFGCGLSVNLP